MYNLGIMLIMSDFFPNQSRRQVGIIATSRREILSINSDQVPPNRNVQAERQEGVQCAEVEAVVEVVVAELRGEGEGSAAIEAVEAVEEALVEAVVVGSVPGAAVVVVVMRISRDLQEGFADVGHKSLAGRWGAWIAFRMLHNGMDPHVSLCESKTTVAKHHTFLELNVFLEG